MYSNLYRIFSNKQQCTHYASVHNVAAKCVGIYCAFYLRIPLGAAINPNKTKYVRFSASPPGRSVKGTTINGVTCEAVAEFIYWGRLIGTGNGVGKEIQRRILAGNRIGGTR